MIEYSRITAHDIDQVINMYEKYLNSGDFMKQHIIEGIKDPNYVGFKAMDGDRMVGMMSGRAGFDLTYPHPEIEERIFKQLAGEKVYSPDACTVIEEYRGSDVSVQLGKLVLGDILEKGYHMLVIELWIYPDGHIPAYHVVNQWGEMVYETDSKDFYKDLDQYGMACPICGPHCTCGAKIVLIKISKESVKKIHYKPHSGKSIYNHRIV